MFEGFEQVKDEQARKRWFASTGTSVVIVIVVGIGIAIIAKQQVSKAQAEPEIDVTFQSSEEPEEIKKEPPPPPPPPPKTQAPKVKRPGKVAPAQPTVIPEERPSEAEPTGEGGGEVIEEFGDGELGGLGDEENAPPPPPPPPPPPERDEPAPDPIHEKDTSFVRAEPRAGNPQPVYPESARKKGTEAIVRLKVRISPDGEVIDVKVVDGDEPFASAAIAAVQTWRWKPATDNGKPVASTRLVSIPFRLRSPS